MKNPVCWFEIYAQDMPRAKRFYATAFEVEFQEMDMPEEADMSADPNMTMLMFPADTNTYGITGALVKMAGVPSGGNSTVVYFSCDDCALTESKVVAAGGKIFREKSSIGENGFISLAYDSEGNMFGLHSMQ